MNEKPSRTKLTYEKPEVRIIDLAAEEVLADACKASVVAPEGAGANFCNSGTCVINVGPS